MVSLPNEFFDTYLSARMRNIGRLKNRDFLMGGGLSLFYIFTREKGNPFEIISFRLYGSLLPRNEYLEYWMQYAFNVRDCTQKIGIEESVKIRCDFLEKYYARKLILDPTCLVALEIVGKQSKTYKNLKENPLCIILFIDHSYFFINKGIQLNCTAEIIDTDSKLFKFLDDIRYINCFTESLPKAECAYKFKINECWYFEAPSDRDIQKLS